MTANKAGKGRYHTLKTLDGSGAVSSASLNKNHRKRDERVKKR